VACTADTGVPDADADAAIRCVPASWRSEAVVVKVSSRIRVRRCGRCEERAKVTASRCGRQPAAAKRAKTGGRFQIKRPALIRRDGD
jgi:hypothetical protein